MSKTEALREALLALQDDYPPVGEPDLVLFSFPLTNEAAHRLAPRLRAALRAEPHITEDATPTGHTGEGT